MSSVILLNEFLTERLTAVAVEICGEVEKTITVYKEEISRSKEEIDRLRRLLQIITQPKIKLHRTDALHVTVPVLEEAAPVHQQHYKQDPEPIQVKEEPKEFITNKEEEFQGLESDTCILKSSHLYVKGDWGQADPCNCPQLNHIQARETREQDLISASPTKEMEPEPDTEGYRLSTPCDSLPLSVVTPYSSVGTFTKCPLFNMAEKPYQCNDCGKFLKRKRSLIVHRMGHAGEKPFSCPICHKSFVALGTLKIHLKLHTGERPHRCFVCGRCFKLKGALTEHMRIHTGEKPFHCQDCGKCFSRTNALTNHMLHVHKKRRT